MTGQSPLLSCLPLDAKRQVESWVHNVQSHLKENTHSFRRLTERATAHFRHLGSYSRSILTRGTHAVRGAVEVLARMYHLVITSPCLPHSSLTHCFELRVCVARAQCSLSQHDHRTVLGVTLKRESRAGWSTAAQCSESLQSRSTSHVLAGLGSRVLRLPRVLGLSRSLAFTASPCVCNATAVNGRCLRSRVSLPSAFSGVAPALLLFWCFRDARRLYT